VSGDEEVLGCVGFTIKKIYWMNRCTCDLDALRQGEEERVIRNGLEQGKERECCSMRVRVSVHVSVLWE
jgi:hypothetical protein